MKVSGYVIVPIEFLDEGTADQIRSTEKVISKKEMVSMYNSACIEINRGDRGAKSLNVKLYNCLSHYAQGELDEMAKGEK